MIKSLRAQREKITAQINALYNIRNHRLLTVDENQKLIRLEAELESLT